jgi:hypothetical protein
VNASLAGNRERERDKIREKLTGGGGRARA